MVGVLPMGSRTLMTLLYSHIEAFLLSQETEVQEMAALHEASHGRESIEGLEKFISLLCLLFAVLCLNRAHFQVAL